MCYCYLSMGSILDMYVHEPAYTLYISAVTVAAGLLGSEEEKGFGIPGSAILDLAAGLRTTVSTYMP